MTTLYAMDLNNGKVHFAVTKENMDAACEAIAKESESAEPYIFASDEIDKFSGPDIVNMHNSLLPEGRDPVKRFATKSAGMKRLEAVLENAPEFAGAAAPKPKKKVAKKKVAKKKVAKKKATTKVKTEVSNKERSEAIKETWSNKSVREARRKRYNVRVHNVTYRSVPQAFEELGIPKHRAIKFRAKLRDSEEGKATYTDEKGKQHTFTIVNDEE